MRKDCTVLWLAEGSVSPLCQTAVQERIWIARGLSEALVNAGSGEFDAIVVQMPFGAQTAGELLAHLQDTDPDAPVIIMEADLPVSEAVRLVRLGAYHVFASEIEPDIFLDHLESAIEARRARRRGQAGSRCSWRELMVGSSKAMQNVANTIEVIAERRSTVLITGETGTGKEIAARAIHLASSRSSMAFVAVNCAAIPEHLIESELFGHVKGAFTSAVQNRTGRFEQANKGTILLDEVGELPLDLQAKLLRVLQERELQRVRSSETVRLDVRVIAATNADLTQKVRQGLFREDLYYRLNVVPIQLPPLRRRTEDIPMLVEHFLAKICRIEELPQKRVSPAAIERLCSLPWPGNVRQLENAVEMAIAVSGARELLLPCDFRAFGPEPVPAVTMESLAEPAFFEEGLAFDAAVARYERTILMEALRKTNGNKTHAADMLGMKRTTLLAKLRNLESTCAAA